MLRLGSILGVGRGGMMGCVDCRIEAADFAEAAGGPCKMCGGMGA